MGKTKRCSKCGNHRSINKYGIDIKSADNKRSVCNHCVSRMPSNRFNNLRKSASRRGIDVDIDLCEYKSILENKNYLCEYCNDDVSGSSGGSLDRIDNDIGYLKGNLKVCCGNCNHMKRHLSEDEFIKHIRKIYLGTLREPK